MSVPVPLERLRAAIEERGTAAYLLTVAADVRPHVVHTVLLWEGDVLVADVGTRSAENAGARPSVSLLFAPGQAGGYSLIVDGTAVVQTVAGGGGRVLITPTRAVLHRPAVAGAAPSGATEPGGATPSTCSADCVPILPARARGD